MKKYTDFMSDSLNKNLNEEDYNQAIESLRLLIKGIPIKDDEGTLIGFIEKPDMNAIKYVLGTRKPETTANNSKHQSIEHNKFTGLRHGSS
jgi:hypothetical protein